MQTVTVFIQHGHVTFLDNPLTAGFNLGPAVTRRASHVEPDGLALRGAFHTLRWLFGEKGRVSEWTRGWRCLWRANMAPSGGPVLPGRWRDRKQAIAAEVEHFNIFGIQKENQ